MPRPNGFVDFSSIFNSEEEGPRGLPGRQDREVRQGPGGPPAPPLTVDNAVEGGLGSEEQAPAMDLLDDQSNETQLPEEPGMPPMPPARISQPNTPLALGNFAQIGSEAAAPFRSANFFTNRAMGSGGPLRFSAGAGSAGLGGAPGGFGGGEEEGQNPEMEMLRQAVLSGMGGGQGGF